MLFNRLFGVYLYGFAIVNRADMTKLVAVTHKRGYKTKLLQHGGVGR